MRYVRNEEILAQPVDDQVILLSADRAELLTLNATGAAVWNALDEPGDLDALVSRIVTAWPDADATVVKADVVPFLSTLMERGVVTAED